MLREIPPVWSNHLHMGQNKLPLPLTAPHLNISGEKPQGLIASGGLVWVECRISAPLLWSVNHRFPFPVALAWPCILTRMQLCTDAHADTLVYTYRFPYQRLFFRAVWASMFCPLLTRTQLYGKKCLVCKNLSSKVLILKAVLNYKTPRVRGILFFSGALGPHMLRHKHFSPYPKEKKKVYFWILTDIRAQGLAWFWKPHRTNLVAVVIKETRIGEVKL